VMDKGTTTIRRRDKVYSFPRPKYVVRIS